MARQDNIVTFEEARRSAKRRRRSSGSGAPTSALTQAIAVEADPKRSRKKKDVTPVPKRTRKRAEGAAAAGATPASAQAQRSESSRKQAADARKKAADARKQARSDAKRRRNKARADKKFAKMYGDGGGTHATAHSASHAASAANASSGAPRAAVYEAKMGTKHRKAAHALQQKAADGLSAASGFIGGLTLPDLSKLPKRTMRILTVIACCAFLTLMLYAPAQQCYTQMRDRDRVAAEYAAVLDRNEALADSVDTLQSDEGIEDKAHAEYGMVKDGEEAGSVTGIDVQSSTDFVANVVPGAVPAPDTWYSGILDFLFGYSNPR